MLSLATMQKTDATELRAIALHTPNRQFAIACSAMASAMDAHAVGDVAMVKAFVERAKTAHKRGQEDEAGQLARVRATAAVLAARGIESTCVTDGVYHGPGTFHTYSTGRKRDEVSVRSR